MKIPVTKKVAGIFVYPLFQFFAARSEWSRRAHVSVKAAKASDRLAAFPIRYKDLRAPAVFILCSFWLLPSR